MLNRRRACSLKNGKKKKKINLCRQNQSMSELNHSPCLMRRNNYRKTVRI